MATTEARDQVTTGVIPERYDWALTWYVDQDPHEGPSGECGNVARARSTADEELRGLPPGVEAYATVFRVPLTGPTSKQFLARGERNPGGEIEWYDIVDG